MNTFKQFFNVVSTENNDCNLDTISNDYRSNYKWYKKYSRWDI